MNAFARCLRLIPALVPLSCVLAVAACGATRDSHPVDVEAMAKAAEPGEAHLRLCARAGAYATHTRMWPQPGGTPMETEGSARLSTVLGGRFLLEESPLAVSGQPLSGMRLWGYNNGSKRYEAIWIYDQSTAVMTMTGTSTDGGATVHFTAKFDNEVGGTDELEVVRREIDADHFVVELIGEAADGRKGPMLETTYTRKL